MTDGVSKNDKMEVVPQQGLTLPRWMLIAVLAVSGIGTLASLYLNGQATAALAEQQREQEEVARPAELRVITVTAPDCPQCNGQTALLNLIQKENVKLLSEKGVDSRLPEGVSLVQQYSLTKLPALIISGELDKLPSLRPLWAKYGEIKDGVFVQRQVAAPYLEIGSGQVRGLVDLTMIGDQGCEKCYQVTNHQSVLGRYGIAPLSSVTVDRSSAEGRRLIRQYKITQVPTILLSGDLGVYPEFQQVWKSVGTVESDGTHVFRKPEQMGAYRDLTSGKIVDQAGGEELKIKN